MVKEATYTIKVLEKVFNILALYDDKQKKFTNQEISDLLGYNKSSTYRIIRNLEKVAYLERIPGTQYYKLGFGLYYIGTNSESYGPLLTAARPLLVRLNDSCGETVHLAVLHQGQPLYIDKIESSKRVLQIRSRVGSKLPGHCSGVGKLLLSFLGEKKRTEVIEEWGLAKFTENTIIDAAVLVKEFEKIRQQGYSIDNEEIEYGLKCIAAPIFDSGRNVIAAASISTTKERFDSDFDNLKSMILETTKEIGLQYEEKRRNPSSFNTDSDS